MEDDELSLLELRKKVIEETGLSEVALDILVFFYNRAHSDKK